MTTETSAPVDATSSAESREEAFPPNPEAAKGNSPLMDQDPSPRPEDSEPQQRLDDDPFSGPDDPAAYTLPESARLAFGISSARLWGPAAFGSDATVIGSVHHHHQGHRSPLFQLAPLARRDVIDMTGGYSMTASDDLLRHRLAERHVVCLSGREGSGRDAAALTALVAAYPLDRLARIVPAPAAALADLTGDARLLRKDHGHILATHARQRIDAMFLAVLEGIAERAGSRVVVIGPDGLSGQGLNHYVVPHQPPSPAEVLRSWLRYRLAERCLADCPSCTGACRDSYIAEAVEDMRTSVAQMARLDEVMRLATHVAVDLPDADQRIRLAAGASGQDLRQHATRLLQWDAGNGFGDLRDARHRQAFRLAYAILQDQPLTHVFEATAMLLDLLNGAEGTTRGSRSVLRLDVDSLLGEGVRGVEQTADTIGGGGPRCATLRHREIADHLLDVAWHDYDTARRPLLNWISLLGGHRSPHVRGAAAAVAGRLCAYDLEEIYERVVNGWATDVQVPRRQSAALACLAAAEQKSAFGEVVDRVRKWVSDDNAGHVYRRDTAARVYATDLGSAIWPYALEDLTTIAADEVQRFSRSVPRAIAAVYGPGTGGPTIRQLASWTESRREALRDQSCLCLVELTQRPANPDRGTWPEVLADLADGGVDGNELARLWRRALTHPQISAEAWRALAYWISCADRFRPAADALLEMLPTVFSDRALRRRGRFYLDHQWRSWLGRSAVLDDMSLMLREVQP